MLKAGQKFLNTAGPKIAQTATSVLAKPAGFAPAETPPNHTRPASTSGTPNTRPPQSMGSTLAGRPPGGSGLAALQAFGAGHAGPNMGFAASGLYGMPGARHASTVAYPGAVRADGTVTGTGHVQIQPSAAEVERMVDMLELPHAEQPPELANHSWEEKAALLKELKKDGGVAFGFRPDRSRPAVQKGVKDSGQLSDMTSFNIQADVHPLAHPAADTVIPTDAQMKKNFGVEVVDHGEHSPQQLVQAMDYLLTQAKAGGNYFAVGSGGAVEGAQNCVNFVDGYGKATGIFPPNAALGEKGATPMDALKWAADSEAAKAHNT